VAISTLPRFLDTEAPRACAVLFLIAWMAVTACAPPPGDDVVATSDLGNITRDDLERYILSLSDEQRRPAADQTLVDWRRSKVDDLLIARALSDEAEPLLERPAAQSAVQQARFAVLVDAYVERFIDPEVDVSDEALRRYYDAHKEEFGHGEQIRLRNIFRRVDSDATPAERAAIRAEFEELLDALRNGASFGDIARTESDSETAHLHGLIGRLDRGQLDPKLEEIVWNLDEGEISDIIDTPVGFHIFRLDNHIEPSQLAFDEAKGRLARRLQKIGSEALFDEHFEKLLAESGASYNPEILAAREAVEPTTVVFELDDHLITMASIDRHRRVSTFFELRTQPADEWVKNVARNRLFVWKAERVGLDEEPEIQRRIDAAEREAKVRIATEKRVDAVIAELEAEGVLEAYYHDNLQRFQSPRLHRMRIIRSDFDSYEKPYDALELLVELRKKIESGETDMAEAARLYSDDPSASAGGDIGFLRIDGFGKWAGPRAQNVVAYLKPGELSEPLLVELYDRAQLTYERTGFLLVRIEEVRESEVIPYEQAGAQIRRQYVERHRPELEARIRDDVLSAIHARILEENL